MAYNICGCYYHIVSAEYHIRMVRHYLPLLESEAQSTILSTTSRTVLKQTFTNPSSTDDIRECVYNFPLYDGVSVVDFTCRVGDKVLRGLVKEKAKAKKIFDDAVANGETAGLLEQSQDSSDVFSTKLGNIPAGKSVIVEVTYIGELKHHDTEGIRFTIPTSIAPRYGSTSSNTSGESRRPVNSGGIKITVDVNMPEGQFLKSVQSPSHPIAVSMGTISTATNADPVMSKASATLALGSAALEKDFVLIVQAKDVGTPRAILEQHPTIPNHRALMTTLVPKFSLPPLRPEIVFVADRSGSMVNNIPMLVSAMQVFLKSMPVGVKFNICSFGSSCRFLWAKSKAYSAETLTESTKHLKSFDANMGGTETLAAIKATVDRRFKDLPLEIILLTDGDIWQQGQLFEYVNEEVAKSGGKIRVFPLGIGNGVSHSLIEGLARAGNGFAQSVQDGERLDSYVVRMLRGALSPHITDYTLEVKYAKEEDDDFEIIETVTEGMKVLLSEKPADEKEPQKLATISLFDNSANPDTDTEMGIESANLVEIPTPKLLQAPHKIPTLFPFSRSVVYLLMSPETSHRTPTAVILKATSEHGPLRLEIPVEVLPSPAETIHQLAARKAVQDLEEGRGWIYDAKDENGKLIKDRFPSSFDELVQREAVRLGEKFQVAGKWCSFVAVSANGKEIAERQNAGGEKIALDDLEEAEQDSDDDFQNIKLEAQHSNRTIAGKSSRGGGGAMFRMRKKEKSNSRASDLSGNAATSACLPRSPLLARSAAPQQMMQQQTPGSAMLAHSIHGISDPMIVENCSCPPTPPAPAPTRRSAMGRAASSITSPIANLHAKLPRAGMLRDTLSSLGGARAGRDPLNEFTTVGDDDTVIGDGGMMTDWTQKSIEEKVMRLIELQAFEGYWNIAGGEVAKILGVDVEKEKKEGVDARVWVTLLVVVWLEEAAAAEEGTWGLVGEKAKAWVGEQSGVNVAKLEEEAKGVVRAH